MDFWGHLHQVILEWYVEGNIHKANHPWGFNYRSDIVSSVEREAGRRAGVDGLDFFNKDFDKFCLESKKAIGVIENSPLMRALR